MRTESALAIIRAPAKTRIGRWSKWPSALKDWAKCFETDMSFRGSASSEDHPLVTIDARHVLFAIATKGSVLGIPFALERICELQASLKHPKTTPPGEGPTTRDTHIHARDMLEPVRRLLGLVGSNNEIHHARGDPPTAQPSIVLSSYIAPVMLAAARSEEHRPALLADILQWGVSHIS